MSVGILKGDLTSLITWWSRSHGVYADNPSDAVGWKFAAVPGAMILNPPRSQLIPLSFYLRPVEVVARELLGQLLVHGEVALRITEVEAYGGQDDTASHCRHGRTPRNAPMWEEGGRAYIYLCYGLHKLLNLVTGPAGAPAAVLIRACEPVSGLETVLQRRGARKVSPALLTGPGKVSQALDLDLGFNHHLLYTPGGLEVRYGKAPERIVAGPRIGIDYAWPEHREAPLRFAIEGSAWVAQPGKLG